MNVFTWIWAIGSLLTCIVLMSQICKEGRGLEPMEAFSALMIIIGWWVILGYFALNAAEEFIKQQFNKGSKNGSK